ncbi:hypothetical protein CK203_054829 [Vitis vinifera]|uniref:Uncharacterized protein n=1 Tax=Vitis vinifera TaxID=29760 RepID=A0A438H4M5_VITVI|nr:hypothetical protein CK203_054829 [Vitis vinifera]
MQGKNNGEEENRGQHLQSSFTLLEHFPKSFSTCYIPFKSQEVKNPTLQTVYLLRAIGGEVFNSKFCINPLEPISMAIERDKKGVENVVADYLSRLAIAHNSHVLPINDDFPEESLMLLEKNPWYAHIANYLVTGEVPSEWKAQDKKHLFGKIHAIIGKSLFFSSIVQIR